MIEEYGFIALIKPEEYHEKYLDAFVEAYREKRIDQMPVLIFSMWKGYLNPKHKAFNRKWYELNGFAGIINEMPLYYKLTVNKKRYIIVHAGYCENEAMTKEQKEHFCLYAREDAYTTGGVPGTTIIAGHTPTILPEESVYTGGEVFYYHNRQNDCRFFDIDCGCAYRESPEIPNGRLACIRLQDEEIFYV